MKSVGKRIFWMRILVFPATNHTGNVFFIFSPTLILKILALLFQTEGN